MATATRSRSRRRLTTTQQGLGFAWQKRRLRILARDRHRCHWCGRYATTVDHLIPRAEGGGMADDNLVAACVACNSRRGGELAAARTARRHRVQRTPAQRRVWPGAIRLEAEP